MGLYSMYSMKRGWRVTTPTLAPRVTFGTGQLRYSLPPRFSDASLQAMSTMMKSCLALLVLSTFAMAQSAPAKSTETTAKTQRPAGSNAPLSDPTSQKSRNTNLTDVYAFNAAKKPKPASDAAPDSQTGTDSQRGPRQTLSLDGTLGKTTSGAKDAAPPTSGPRPVPLHQSTKPTPAPGHPSKNEPEAAK